MAKLKRASTAILCLLAALALLAGCGNGAAPAGSGAASDESGLKAVTIKFQTIGDMQSDMPRIVQAVNDYLKSIGRPYSVELAIEGWGTYNDVVNLMLNTGEKFDVVFTANWAASYLTNAPNGVFADLGPYLEKNPEIEQILTADFMNASRIGGINYALPTNKEKARQIGWLLRKDFVDQMGLDLSTVKSNEDLEPWFIKAKEEFNVWVYPSFVPSNYMYDRIEEPIIGMETEDGSNTVLAVDLTDRFKDAVRLYNKWFKLGLINPDLNRESQVQTEFASGKYLGATYQLKPGKAAEEAASIGYDLVQVELNEPEIASSETTGAMLAIPAASENKNEAFDFIKLLYTDEKILNLFVWGEDGKDYNTVSPGIIELIPDSGWAWGQGWTMGNQFNNYLTTAEDPEKWKKFEEFNEAGRPVPSLGFIPDTTDTEMQTAIKAMKAVRENYTDLFFGYVDDIDGSFAKLESDYKAAGMDGLLAAYQKQFDEWKAAQ
ncbi:MAG: ABC transporter substrate-binding protein [Clostridiales bacterium]|jgi:putative aldouronate transport system substrate-binding protein|nr:ABC transporter substrate-binding protein [Clostridiales bacterium]